MTILIKINSQTSPQEIFKLQANAEALENWAKNNDLSPQERAEYYRKIGLNHLQEK